MLPESTARLGKKFPILARKHRFEGILNSFEKALDKNFTFCKALHFNAFRSHSFGNRQKNIIMAWKLYI